MDTAKWVGIVRSFCLENANAAHAGKYLRYFKEGYDAYGLEQKQMEKQRTLWLAELKRETDFNGVLDLAEALLVSGKYEETNFAIWFTAAFKKEYTPAVFERLGGWFDRGFANWAHTDFFCGEVLSRFIVGNVVPIEAFRGWRDSPSKWQRRAVPVSLIKPLKTDIPIESMLDLIEPMMLDAERPVQQGLGWFLREAWKKYPGPVEAFLFRWKDRCGRTIVQYATEKMEKEEKQRFAKEKKPGKK